MVSRCGKWRGESAAASCLTSLPSACFCMHALPFSLCLLAGTPVCAPLGAVADQLPKREVGFGGSRGCNNTLSPCRYVSGGLTAGLPPTIERHAAAMCNVGRAQLCLEVPHHAAPVCIRRDHNLICRNITPQKASHTNAPASGQGGTAYRYHHLQKLAPPPLICPPGSTSTTTTTSPACSSSLPDPQQRRTTAPPPRGTHEAAGLPYGVCGPHRAPASTAAPALWRAVPPLASKGRAGAGVVWLELAVAEPAEDM